MTFHSVFRLPRREGFADLRRFRMVPRWEGLGRPVKVAYCASRGGLRPTCGGGVVCLAGRALADLRRWRNVPRGEGFGRPEKVACIDASLF